MAQISVTSVSPDSAWSVQPMAGMEDVDEAEPQADPMRTLTLEGSGMFPAMEVRLTKDGEPDIVGAFVGGTSTAMDFAFDFTGAAPGRWDLEAAPPGGDPAVLTGAVKVRVMKLRRLSAWGGPVMAMEIVGNLGYVARGSGLVVLDVTDPAAMTEVGSLDLGVPLLHDIAVSGDYAYLCALDGVAVVDVSDPAVTVRAAYSKHRREDTLPLRPSTAEELRTFMATLAPSAQVFKLTPDRRVAAKMFRDDLAAAGIKRVDDAGRVIDFHALRHTFISNLAAGGVHPKVAQALARHSTITLTMDRYSHVVHGDQAAALATLPDLTTPPVAESARAVGTTDDRPKDITPHNSENLAASLSPGCASKADSKKPSRASVKVATNARDAKTPGN